MSPQTQNTTTPAQNDPEKAIPDKDVRQEASKAARKSQDAKREAYRLRQAAHGAADAEERQRLLEKAIDKEIEAESFGKTAKYMRKGTFQGMAVGTGIGVVPGATLGTLTGTLVGGVTSLVTGGLGALAGTAVGALHGPFWNMGEMAGKGIQKVTGNLPGREATEDQKNRIREMMGQINEEEMPNEEELKYLELDDGSDEWWDSKVQGAKSYMPAMPSWLGGGKKDSQAKSNPKPQAQEQGSQQKPRRQYATGASRAAIDAAQGRKPAATPTQKAGDSLSRHLNETQTTRADRQPPQRARGTQPDGKENVVPPQERKKPRKLEVRSGETISDTSRAKSAERKPPRKLEKRSS